MWDILRKAEHMQACTMQGACMAVMDAYSAAGSSSNKAVRSSWASFLVNMSLLLCPPSHAASQGAAASSEGQAMVLSAAAELLSSCPEDDVETIARWVEPLLQVLLLGKAV